MVTSFVIGIYIARYLGPSRYGILNYALSFVAVISPMAGFGLKKILIRELVNQPENRNNLLGTAFAIRLLGFVFLLAILASSLSVLSNERSTNLLILVIAAGVLFQSFEVVDYYFQSKVLSKYIAWVHLMATILATVAKIVLMILKLQLLYFALVISGEYIVKAIGYIIIYSFQNIRIFQWRFNKAVALGLLKNGWPLLLAGFVGAVHQRIDIVLIKQLTDSESVGYYSIAVKLVGSWYILGMIICRSLFPAIVNARNVGDSLFNYRLQLFYDLMLWISLGIAVAGFIVADLLITFLYGQAYAPAVGVLKIYIFSLPATFLSLAGSQFLVAENLIKLSLYRGIFSTITNVILNLVLIPLFGIKGAAVATVISYMSTSLFLLIAEKSRSQVVLMIRSFYLPAAIKRMIGVLSIDGVSHR